MESGELFSLWLLLLVLCELFESWWQHAPTLKDVMERVRYYYRTDIFLLFAMHPSFWLVLFIYVTQEFHGTLLALILVMKATDIAFKLWMTQKLEEGTLSPDFKGILEMPLSAWMPWINVIVYPAMLAFSLPH